MAYKEVKTIELKKAIRVIMMASLIAALVFTSVVEAGLWSSPSMVTDPAFCGLGTHGCPSISGDGSKIAFVANTNATGFTDNKIFVINSDGTGLTQIANSSEFTPDEVPPGEPTISYDGSKIAFALDDGSGTEIFVINSDGTGLTKLTDNEFLRGSYEPSISGDGSKIAFRRVDFDTWNRGIFVVNSDGTEEKQLTDSYYFDEQPSISYDGGKIAFLGADDFDFQYFVINSDGTGLTQLTQNSNNWQDVNNNNFPLSGPSISADGSKVAFTGFVGEDTEIFVINSDGTGLRQLTDNAENEWAPAISGDGSRIVFQRTSMQQEPIIKGTKIFVINSDGTGLTKLTDDSERTFLSPSISDNGEKIVFWSHYWSGDPSSSSIDDFEYENVLSLVRYLSDSEDEKSGASTFLTEIAVGGTLAIATVAMTAIYLKGKKPWKG